MDIETIQTVSVAIVGLCTVNLVGKAMLHLYKTFLRPGKNLKKLGKWAVVTGATGELEQHFVCGNTGSISIDIFVFII